MQITKKELLTSHLGEIRKAYMKKAKEHHPDKNMNNPEANRKFQEMAAAYEILNDPQSRESYDMYGIDDINGSARAQRTEDIFAQFFGAGIFEFDTAGPGLGRRRGKGPEEIQYDVTLEDLYNGKSVKINMEREAMCGQCNGSGARGKAKPKSCVTCEGSGFTIVYSQIASSRIGSSRSQCHSCNGTGQKLREKDCCKKCKGEKTVTEKKRHEINIEKGMVDRQRIVLAGVGDEEPGFPPGDVVFVLHAEPHTSFERSGNDLLTHVTVTLSEALFGFSRMLVTHLDGRGIMVTSPSGKIIKPDDSIVLRGEGMPIHKQPDQKGDLYVVLSIEMPDEQWLKMADRKILEPLLPPRRTNPDPLPDTVVEGEFEESDILDFGGGTEEEWTDEDDDKGPEPECRQQ